MEQHFKIWGKEPMERWEDGMPLGNGKLTSIVWGTEEDIVSLNHESLWRGVTRMRDNDKVPKEVLGEIRDLIDKEKFFRATAVTNAWLGGEGAGCSGRKNRMDSFQPAGDICFRLDNESNYGGYCLDLKTAIAEVVRKTADGAEVKFTSYIDANQDVIVCRWEADSEFGGTLFYTRPDDEAATVKNTYAKDSLAHECSFDGGICYKTFVSVTTDGASETTDDGIHISNAKTIMALANISVFTDAVMGENPTIPPYDYEEEKKRHSETFRKEMESYSLEIKTEGNSDVSTPELVARAKEGEKNDDLVLLYFNFGRYVFLASNLRAYLPAHLQGKWNRKINPPWGCDYHLDVNIQMNYWMAEPLGLGEYHDRMFNLIEKALPHAKKAAKDLYGCRGMWLPHAFDGWGRCTPESYGFAAWVGAAPWLCQHYWMHYLYTNDKEFLKQRAYPVFKEVAEFYEDYMVRDKDGVYQIYPSQSPENAFAGVGVFPVSISKSTAMDVQLAYTALGYAIDAAEILGVDKKQVKLWKKMKENLPPFRIGSDGRIMEWDKEYEEKEVGHRHLSHLFGLFPSDIFDSEIRPEHYKAVKKSMDVRLSNDCEQGAWNSSWVACMYARLGEGEVAYNCMFNTIDASYKSLLYAIYTRDWFQIDGNYSFSAAVNEMLSQYRGDKLYLLFGAPKHWTDGSVKGLKTPGGHTVDFTWKDGKVTDITVIIGFGGELKVNMNGEDVVFAGEEGEILSKGEDSDFLI